MLKLKQFIMKLMGFESIRFGNTELYFQNPDEKTKSMLRRLETTGCSYWMYSTKTNENDLDNPFAILVLTNIKFTLD